MNWEDAFEDAWEDAFEDGIDDGWTKSLYDNEDAEYIPEKIRPDIECPTNEGY